MHTHVQPEHQGHAARSTPASRIDTCRANLRALGHRAGDLDAAFEHWAQAIEAAGETSGPDEARRLIDAAAGVQIPWLRPDGSPDPARSPKPVIVEGISPPWLLRRLVDATAPFPDGYSPALIVVQRSAAEFLDGLALAPLAQTLADPRITFIVGEDAPQRLRAHLLGALDLALPGHWFLTPGTRERLHPAPAAIVAEAGDHQQARHRQLHARVEEVYAHRPGAWWKKRFAEALGAAPLKPLRILLPITRYSTFVRHSAADLAESFNAMGHEARVLTEPDDYGRLASIAYLSRFADWRPDLVVLLNYTRQQMGAAVPRMIPFVCWIQDAMPHLYSRECGIAQGELDFIAGHTSGDLFADFGYPRARALSSPVLASARKFHPGPVAPALLERYACDIAYVSHQSEPAERFTRRMLDAAPPGTPAHRAVEAAVSLVQAAVADAMRRPLPAALTEAAREALRAAAGAEPAPTTVAVFQHQFIDPLAEKYFRHQMLGWAAELASERGRTFRIYGRGWEDHPDFAPFAAGELDHGEELRAAYQGATVHLHGSVNVLVHQRVLECALAGGLPAGRLTLHEVHRTVHRLIGDALRRHEPTACTVALREASWQTSDCHELMTQTALMQRLGLAGQPARYWYRKPIAALDKFRARGPAEDWLHPDRVFGDLAETCFWDKPSLAALIERATGLKGWREHVSSAIAARVRERLTYDVFARRLLRHVADRLPG